MNVRIEEWVDARMDVSVTRNVVNESPVNLSV